MAISVSLTVVPAAPAHGDTVTATYVVVGNDPIPGQTLPVHGSVNIGGVDYVADGTLTAPGSPALVEQYAIPTCAGLTFVATANPRVFTAVMP